MRKAAKPAAIPAVVTAIPAIPVDPVAVEKRNARWVIGTFATLTAVLGVGLTALALRPAPVPPPLPVVVQQVVVPTQSAEYVAAIAEGQRLLLAGDPGGAARSFAVAEGLDSADATARQLRLEAERQASLTPAPSAPAVPPVRVARAAPPPVDPPIPPRSSVAPAVAPVPAPPSESTAPSELQIDFFTEVSPGVLTVYVGREQIYREAFRLQRRSGLGRTAALAGQRPVPSGDADLRVIVSLEGRPTKVLTLQGNLPGGKSRTLQVRVDTTGLATAKLL